MIYSLYNIGRRLKKSFRGQILYRSVDPKNSFHIKVPFPKKIHFVNFQSREFQFIMSNFLQFFFGIFAFANAVAMTENKNNNQQKKYEKMLIEDEIMKKKWGKIIMKK